MHNEESLAEMLPGNIRSNRLKLPPIQGGKSVTQVTACDAIPVATKTEFDASHNLSEHRES